MAASADTVHERRARGSSVIGANGVPVLCINIGSSCESCERDSSVRV